MGQGASILPQGVVHKQNARSHIYWCTRSLAHSGLLSSLLKKKLSITFPEPTLSMSTHTAALRKNNPAPRQKHRRETPHQTKSCKSKPSWHLLFQESDKQISLYATTGLGKFPLNELLEQDDCDTSAPHEILLFHNTRSSHSYPALPAEEIYTRSNETLFGLV